MHNEMSSLLYYLQPAPKSGAHESRIRFRSTSNEDLSNDTFSPDPNGKGISSHCHHDHHGTCMTSGQGALKSMPNEIIDQQTNQQTEEDSKNDEPPASLHLMIMVSD